ncbi:MAG: SIS domain-containing protein [Bacillota bacterium]
MNVQTHLNAMLFDHPELKSAQDKIQSAYAMIAESFAAGGKLLLCGNGGSACDCEHIAGELMKGFQLKRPLTPSEKDALTARGAEGGLLAESLQRGLPVLVLSGLIGFSTAFANDVDPAMCYAQQAFVYAGENDVLLALSTSGNARNVRLAAVAAKARGAKVIALTGEGGGALAAASDLLVDVPQRETYRVQELHLAVYHCLCLMLEAHFFGKED